MTETIPEKTMETLLLMLLRERAGGRRSHNSGSVGIARGSNIARTLEADGLVTLDEARSGSYVLGVYLLLTDKGEELARGIADQFTPAWIEVRVNYNEQHKAPKINERVRFVDRADTSVVVAEGTCLTEVLGGGGQTPDGIWRALYLLRPLKPSNRGTVREIPVFTDTWQAQMPTRPYGDSTPIADERRRSA